MTRASTLTEPVTLYGADYSVYTRIARLVLEEKGVPYGFEPVDIFEKAELEDYLLRHPFSKIPALEHDGFPLYETGAICRYVDEAFDGPALQPEDAKARARMVQAASILDSYGYRVLVWDVYFERVRVPQKGGTSDEKRITDGLAMSEKVLRALDDIRGGERWLAGGTLSLADCYAYPMIVLFRMAGEGEEMFNRYGGLGEWYRSFGARASARSTRHPMEPKHDGEG